MVEIITSLGSEKAAARGKLLGISTAKVYELRAVKHQDTVQAPYREFGLHSTTADVEDVKKAYRRLSRIYHPDIKETGSAEAFRRMTDTYNLLKNSYNLYTPAKDRRPKKRIRGYLNPGN